LKNCNPRVRERLHIHDSSVRFNYLPLPPEDPFDSGEGVSLDFRGTGVFLLFKGALHNGCGG
jgi:hypothetical protein